MSHATARGIVIRWVKFNFVGGVGIAVQLVVLAILKSGLGLHYLLATALAVEAAVLHNFVWHQNWTWADRPRGRGWQPVLARLVRFNLTTGALSIVSNLVLMRVLVGALRLHYLAGNILAIAITSIGNYLLADWFVFRRARAR